MRQFFFLSLFLICGMITTAQIELTNKQIWASTELNTEGTSSLSFLKDGKHYVQLENNSLISYDIETGQKKGEIFDASKIDLGNEKIRMTDYKFSSSENKILVQTLPKPIYRHSIKADYIVYDSEIKKVQYLDERGEQLYPEFDPEGTRVAYLWENDLHFKDLSSGEITEVTQDGERNQIINGGADWVYEEEFKLTKAYEWSSDGQYLAYIKFNETKVPEFDLKYYNDKSYPDEYSFKYPKVGEPNSKVQVHVFNTLTKVTHALEIPLKSDEFYIPRIAWIPNTNQLVVFYLNRLQNHLQLVSYDVLDQTHRTILDERNKYYINIHDNLTFIPDNEQFLWTSEKDGWNHIYLYDYEGNELRSLTPGEYDVTDFYGYDHDKGKVFYQAAKKSPLKREIYSVDIENGESKSLVDSVGWNSANFNNTFDYYVHRFATINKPPVYMVNNIQGDTLRTINDNNFLKYYQSRHGAQKIEFFDFKNPSGISLNGWMLKPANFDENKKYPLLMYVYGGPNSQQVTDNWKGKNYWYFQMLAQKGYVVACVDNRGTGARGEQFRKMTYLELGKYETEDQISAARFLAQKPFIDSEKVGIFGWSYGGYLSSLCLLKGNDVFTAGIAVAPVTNWKWYDSIYTERYMRTYAENKKGYDQNAPIYYVDRLKGAYLLVHGLADDNVHFQHTAEMTNALISANKQFDTYLYPNMDHGINGGNSRLHLFDKITSFLQENINP